MPFPEILQYVVKFSEIGIGLILIFVTFKGDKLSSSIRNNLFYLGNLAVAVMMMVAIYVHLHPNVPAEVLPMEVKPPFMPIGYLVIIVVNLYLHRRKA